MPILPTIGPLKTQTSASEQEHVRYLHRTVVSRFPEWMGGS